MKRTQFMAIGALLLILVSGAAAQSLGDYARAARKNKPEPSAASHHYDNDNLPTNETLSVVGPPPSGEASASNAKPAAANANAASSAADKQKAADEWQKKLEQQKQTVDSLSHELDIDQRELRLRTAAATVDPSVSVRNVQWNKDDAHYRNEIDEKQKALDAARKQLDDMQEQAHKAGMAAGEKDNDSNKDKDK